MMKGEVMDAKVISILAKEVLEKYSDGSKDIERLSWYAVHNHMHGFYPVEYDIREISESLYLSVLKKSKEDIFN